MATLVAIGYPDETTAAAAAEEVQRLAADLIIEPDAVAVISRDAGGKFHTTTNHQSVGKGTTWGMAWGLLFGMLFFVPFLSADYFRRTIPPDELATAAWTDLERGGGHILPILIDDTRIPPHLLPRHIGYLRARDYSAEDLAQEMLHKVSRARPSH